MENDLNLSFPTPCSAVTVKVLGVTHTDYMYLQLFYIKRPMSSIHCAKEAFFFFNAPGIPCTTVHVSIPGYGGFPKITESSNVDVYTVIKYSFGHKIVAITVAQVE